MSLWQPQCTVLTFICYGKVSVMLWLSLPLLLLSTLVILWMLCILFEVLVSMYCLTGQCGLGGTNVLIVLSPYGWKAHRYHDQGQESKSHGHHRSFRWVLLSLRHLCRFWFIQVIAIQGLISVNNWTWLSSRYPWDLKNNAFCPNVYYNVLSALLKKWSFKHTLAKPWSWFPCNAVIHCFHIFGNGWGQSKFKMTQIKTVILR